MANLIETLPRSPNTLPENILSLYGKIVKGYIANSLLAYSGRIWQGIKGLRI